MLKLRTNLKIFLSNKPTDMRKSIDGLSGMVLETLKRQPDSENLYIFFNKAKDKLIESLKEQLNLFRYDKFNSKTEKNISDEDRAFDEAKTPDNEQEIEEADEDISVKAHTRKKSGSENKKKGRKPLPDNLPRQEILYDINDKDKICSCGIPLSPFLKDSVCEQLEIIPAKLFVKRHVSKIIVAHIVIINLTLH